MIEIIDQTGRTVRLLKQPDRIVSVVPSQTELLSHLGLDEKLSGITKFCIHPEHIFRSKSRIGGTKTLDLKKIEALAPDLIIANKEENQKEQIEELASKFPIYISDIQTLDESLGMITDVGELTGTGEKAKETREKITEGFQTLEKDLQGLNMLSCLYLIWKGPWMATGKNTFVDHILTRSHFRNILSTERYPELGDNDIRNLSPEVILLSSEPFPFKEKHIEELKALCPGSKVLLVDGELFSWYGSRLLHAPPYLSALRKSLS